MGWRRCRREGGQSVEDEVRVRMKRVNGEGGRELP